MVSDHASGGIQLLIMEGIVIKTICVSGKNAHLDSSVCCTEMTNMLLGDP